MQQIPNTLQKDIELVSSHCDSSGRLSLPTAFLLFQDLAGQHARLMGVGAPQLLEQIHALWIIMRTKMVFHRRPGLNQGCRITTWPSRPEMLRCNRHFLLEAPLSTEGFADGLPHTKPLVPWLSGVCEWAIIDATSRKLQRVERIPYPADYAYRSDRAVEAPFRRFRDLCGPEDLVYETVVRSSLIDTSQHMNNVKYCQLVCDAFTTQELGQMDVREMEASYLRECREGEVLRVYRKAVPEGWFCAVKKADDSPAFLSLLVCGGR